MLLLSVMPSLRFLFLFLNSDTVGYQLAACGLAGLLFWLCICYTMRYSLKLLLMYKGWMYEKRAPGSKVSLPVSLRNNAITDSCD